MTAYAPDAVYLPPHHEAVHGRDSIREYLQTPLGRGVRDLVFDVTYIKQSGEYGVGRRELSHQRDAERRKERGPRQIVTVWERAGRKWFIAADEWSSDLPPGH